MVLGWTIRTRKTVPRNARVADRGRGVNLRTISTIRDSTKRICISRRGRRGRTGRSATALKQHQQATPIENASKPPQTTNGTAMPPPSPLKKLPSVEPSPQSKLLFLLVPNVRGHHTSGRIVKPGTDRHRSTRCHRILTAGEHDPFRSVAAIRSVPFRVPCRCCSGKRSAKKSSQGEKETGRRSRTLSPTLLRVLFGFLLGISCGSPAGSLLRPPSHQQTCRQLTRN